MDQHVDHIDAYLGLVCCVVVFLCILAGLLA